MGNVEDVNHHIRKFLRNPLSSFLGSDVSQDFNIVLPQEQFLEFCRLDGKALRKVLQTVVLFPITGISEVDCFLYSLVISFP